MDLIYRKALREYLFTFISDNRINKFNEIIQNRTRHITLVLEDIYQSQNASAVVRSCDIFGVQDIHVIENQYRYDVNPDVALGSSQWINIYRYKNTENNTLSCFNSLREKGYQIIATTPHTKDCMIDELDLSKKTALVFGTELTGLTKTAMENADGFVKIPMYGFTESFNISVSAALSLYHLTEKMRKSNFMWQLSEEEMLDIHIHWAKQSIKKVDLIVDDFSRKYPINHSILTSIK